MVKQIEQFVWGKSVQQVLVWFAFFALEGKHACLQLTRVYLYQQLYNISDTVQQPVVGSTSFEIHVMLNKPRFVCKTSSLENPAHSMYCTVPCCTVLYYIVLCILWFEHYS